MCPYNFFLIKKALKSSSVYNKRKNECVFYSSDIMHKAQFTREHSFVGRSEPGKAFLFIYF